MEEHNCKFPKHLDYLLDCSDNVCKDALLVQELSVLVYVFHTLQTEELVEESETDHRPTQL